MAEIDQGRVEQVITAAAAAVVAAMTGVAFSRLGQEEDEEQDQAVVLLGVDLQDSATPSDAVDTSHVQTLTVRMALRTSEEGSEGARFHHGSLVTQLTKGLRPKSWSSGAHTVVLQRARQETVAGPDDQAGIRVTLVTLTGFVERTSGTDVAF